MNLHRQKQFSEAVTALDAAAQALNRALDSPTDSEDGVARWAKVRALQAQAQLQILHTISWDLDAISDVLHESA